MQGYPGLNKCAFKCNLRRYSAEPLLGGGGREVRPAGRARGFVRPYSSEARVAMECAGNAAGLLSELCAGSEGERRCLELGNSTTRGELAQFGPGALLAAALVAAPAAIVWCRTMTNINLGVGGLYTLNAVDP
jgi:hypothetical protein